MFKHSEETKRKIGLASLGNQRARGYHHTHSAKQRIGKASKGNQYSIGKIPWNKGLKVGCTISDKSRKRISRRMKGNQFAKGFKHPGEKSPSWKGGRIFHQGYIRVRCEGHPKATPHGHYVLEHILVMEERLGRYLEKWEVVHHINGIKSDNRDENLQLFTRAEHTRHHKKFHHLLSPKLPQTT
jgi:HNH endonuclease/NUMOD3 motif-containing protein